MCYSFLEQDFKSNEISFRANIKPVSMQNKNENKLRFKKELLRITSNSSFIITNTCWVAIDYYCKLIDRFKNPGVYDIDNIVKPILDSIVGKDGVLVDDVIVDRVIVNWIDKVGEDHIEISLSYPDLLYVNKSDLVLFKSKSGWCWPCHRSIGQGAKSLIKEYFRLWESIQTNENYCDIIGCLPIQRFIYYSKIKDRDYSFIEL